jgi:hypothetical protein
VRRSLALAAVLAAGCGDNQAAAPDGAAVDAPPACEYPIFGIDGVGCEFAAAAMPAFEERRYRFDVDAGEIIRGGQVIATFEAALRGDVAVVRVDQLAIEAEAIVEIAALAPVILAVDGAARIDGALVADGAVDGAGSAAADCGPRAFGFGGPLRGAGGPPGGEASDGVTAAVPEPVRAGCPSFDPIASQQARPGGGLQLSSPRPASIAGEVRAAGEGGAGGDGATGSGGAGGASGGVVVIDAPGELVGALCADGGGGGGGSGPDPGDDGQPGAAGGCGVRALGGFGPGGGDGGVGSGVGAIDGGPGAATGVGAPGGGGGAAGYILVRPDFVTTGSLVSPPRIDLPSPAPAARARGTRTRHAARAL